ncbi:MAG: hypothetical protein AAGF96_15465 [Bacteroidota bacterium]
MAKPNKVNPSSRDFPMDFCNIIGLDALKKTLERDFFAEVSIDYTISETQIDLVIHLDCNFGLIASLFHLNGRNWGGFRQYSSGKPRTSTFQTALYAINQDNSAFVDIKEFSLHLADTSIVISRIPNLSIQDNLEPILVSIGANFVHFTRGMSRMPYEIFVPIFEEMPSSIVRNIEYPKGAIPSYTNFWGVYFDDCEEAQVYDVQNKAIIDHSDFFLLNELH